MLDNMLKASFYKLIEVLLRSKDYLRDIFRKLIENESCRVAHLRNRIVYHRNYVNVGILYDPSNLIGLWAINYRTESHQTNVSIAPLSAPKFRPYKIENRIQHCISDNARNALKRVSRCEGDAVLWYLIEIFVLSILVEFV